MVGLGTGNVFGSSIDTSEMTANAVTTAPSEDSLETRFQTSSTTYVDVTNISITKTLTSGGVVLISYNLPAYNPTASAQNIVTVHTGSADETICETRTGGSGGTANTFRNNCATFSKTGLSGSTTIKLRAKVTAGTLDTGGGSYYQLTVMEWKK